MILIFFYFSLLITILFFGQSCNETPCLKKKEINLRIAFFKDTGGAEVSTELNFKTFRMKTEKTVFQNNETQILNGIKSPAKTMNIPIPSDSKNVILEFYNDTLMDSFQFTLDPKATFLSTECGFDYTYNILEIKSIKSSTIKKLSIENNKIDTTSKTNHVKAFL